MFPNDPLPIDEALPGLLTPDGVAIVELGIGQAGAVSDLARAAGLWPEPARRDISGVQRALTLHPADRNRLAK